MSSLEIERVPAKSKLVDIMDGAERWNAQVSKDGFVALVDVMPRLVPESQKSDYAVVQAARVSYGEGTKQVSEDKGLIRYLMRHYHTTPSEMVEFKFHAAMPIFVARQWIRHRTANVNEYSGRYSVMPDKFYIPGIEDVRAQSKTNRQGGDEPIEIGKATKFIEYLESSSKEAYERYKGFLGDGIARELARLALPQNLFTEWYWKIDMHNLFKFLWLRTDSHAQKEIRDYAGAMLQLIEPIVPVSVNAFKDYLQNSTTMSACDRRAIERINSGEEMELVTNEEFGGNKRESIEFKEKFSWLINSE